MQRPTQCCCCDARTGLRVLGWYWLIYCILTLFYIWLPGLWLLAVCGEISLIPCFVVFLQMTSSNDHPEKRLSLHKTYLYFAIIFGLTAQFAAIIYVQTQAFNLVERFCYDYGVDCYYTAPSWGSIII